MIKLEITLENQIKELDEFFSAMKTKAVTKAARQAINRTATSLRTFSVKQIQERRKVKASEIRKRIALFRARGNDLARMNAILKYSGIPMPLLLFVSGKKEPRKVSSRSRPLNIEIRRGSKKAKKGLFIASAKHGTGRYQVFRRVDKKDRKQGMVKQSAPSVAQLLRSKRDIRNKLDIRASLLLQKNFSSAFANELAKLR